MDKKNITIIVLIIVLGVAIYFVFQNNQVFQQENSAAGGVLFEKKQDCAVYKKQIEDKFEKNNNSEIAIEYYYFDRIFYSPVEDSCLFVYSGQFGLKATERYRMLYLEDALSGDVLNKATVIEQGKFMSDAQTAFDTRVREYETGQ